ncbi:acyltransferase family protein [Anaerofustis stercorihominis]|uniref:acyltransferase family protein n=1 Tax=Anaerofustis stercorihominis TaxID=214853 RepID=UPI00214D02B5|nr:acyltransferase family protein [Anaerofustis stercorihominis]MCR2032658.1 acyltransferase family protein [Anaerofustis stercorihominis]
MGQSKDKRIYLWDNLKFVLIFLVVLGHFVAVYYKKENMDYIRGIYSFIYFFHMPLFIFITGLFSKKSINSYKFPYKKVISYIILGYFLSFYDNFIRFLLNKDVNFNLLGSSGIIWFLFVIAIFFTITYFLKCVNIKYLFVFSILMGLFVGYDKNIGDYLYIMRSVVFYPFFLAGYYLDPTQIIDKVKNKKYHIISFICILAFIFICVKFPNQMFQFRKLFLGKYPYYNGINIYYRFIYYISVFIFISMVISITPNRYIKGFTQYGSRTLQVYFLHRPMITFVINLGFGTFLMNFCGKFWMIPYFICAIILTYVLSIKFFERPFNFILKDIYKDR